MEQHLESYFKFRSFMHYGRGPLLGRIETPLIHDVNEPMEIGINNDVETQLNKFYQQDNNRYTFEFLIDTNELMLGVKTINSLTEIKYITTSFLEPYAERSPYGDLRTNTTIINEEVRKALEIKGDKLILSRTFKEKDINDFLESLQSDLEYELDRPIKVEINKLNIYKKGGFFKSHTDTPTNPDMIGTLILFLPIDYSGGDLLVRHGGNEHRYEHVYTSNDKLRAIFFYSDCVHEVLPVRLGDRVTITFNVIADKSRIQKTNINNNDKLINAIRRSLENGDNIGIILNHKYTQAISFSNLKDNDLNLFNLLNSKFNIQIQTVLLMNHKVIDINDESLSESTDIYSASEEDFKHFVNNKTSSSNIKSKKYNFFYIKGTEGIVIDSSHTEGAEYTGNECRNEQESTCYLNGAFLIDATNIV